MAMLHDHGTRSQFEQRIHSLTSTARGRWGKMTVDQMLWHVNQAMGLSLGEVTVGPGGPRLPPGLMKFMVMRLPWTKGAPTHPDFVAKANYDFEGERRRLLTLIDHVVHKPIESEWPSHPAFGTMTGREVSQLMAKHLDHHLKQFGV